MESVSLLDAHLHLQDMRFDGQVEAVIRRAEQSGIRQLFCNATREKDWHQVIALGRQYQSISSFVGVHPWYSGSLAKGWQDRLRTLIASSNHNIGETGLDKQCEVAMDIQVNVFKTQLDLAIQFERPIVIHCVRCWGRLITLLETHLQHEKPVPVMIHSYSGPREVMERLVLLGCCLSFSAQLLAPGSEKLRDTFMHTPLDHVLLETDSPDQTCSLRQGVHLNEPAFIVDTYRACARLKEIPFNNFANQIWKNGTIFTN